MALFLVFATYSFTAALKLLRIEKIEPRRRHSLTMILTEANYPAWCRYGLKSMIEESRHARVRSMIGSTRARQTILCDEERHKFLSKGLSANTTSVDDTLFDPMGMLVNGGLLKMKRSSKWTYYYTESKCELTGFKSKAGSLWAFGPLITKTEVPALPSWRLLRD